MAIKIVFIRTFAIFALLSLGACGGSGDSTGGKISSSPSDNYTVCPANYEPVCAKTTLDATCAGVDCPTHSYTTYGNGCSAGASGADSAFDGKCELLEDKTTFSEKPAKIVNEDDMPVNPTPVSIINVQFIDDIVVLEVRYAGGCVPHDFELFLSQPFMESQPPQVHATVYDLTEDACDALVTTEISFDLLPLREFYRRAYGEEEGSVNIVELGVYTFQ